MSKLQRVDTRRQATGPSWSTLQHHFWFHCFIGVWCPLTWHLIDGPFQQLRVPHMKTATNHILCKGSWGISCDACWIFWFQGLQVITCTYCSRAYLLIFPQTYLLLFATHAPNILARFTRNLTKPQTQQASYQLFRISKTETKKTLVNSNTVLVTWFHRKQPVVNQNTHDNKK